MHLVYSTPKVHMSITQLPRRMLPLRSTIQPVARAPYSRHYYVFKEWKGGDEHEHTTERSKKGDTADVHADSSASGMQERKTHEGSGDPSKSQGTTETGGSQYGKQAKKENPKAPEPIIGMNDERGKVRYASLCEIIQVSHC